MIKTFKDLEAYKKAHALVLDVYKRTKQFPSEEKFGLVNQMRRCAVSITSNIAEGFSRGTSKDKVQFYTIALGSLRELESQMLISKDLDFLNPENCLGYADQIELVSKLISGLIKSASSRTFPQNLRSP